MARLIVEVHDLTTLRLELSSSQHVPALGETHMASRSLPYDELPITGHGDAAAVVSAQGHAGREGAGFHPALLRW